MESDFSAKEKYPRILDFAGAVFFLMVQQQNGEETMKYARIPTALVLAVLVTASFGCVGLVNTPPPAHHPVDMRPGAPFRGAVWVEGHYTYRYGNYVWVPGRYEKPPYENAIWIPGSWKKHHRGWKWEEGRWEKRHMRDGDNRRYEHHDEDRDDRQDGYRHY
jgi:hypothetical protein